MLKTRFEWNLLLIMAALLGSSWIVVSRESVLPASGYMTLTEAPIVDHLAPDFSLQTAVGQTITLSEITDQTGNTGRPVVLNFWASWCGPCRVEMPSLQKASLTYNGRVAFIGVNQGEDIATITDFGNEYKVSYPLLIDPDDKVNQRYEITGLPTTIFIGQDGVVRQVVVGILSEAVLQSYVEDMLAENSN
jgi:cytochrome c biogenesis protein CcmG, thiol:disulfide interchange protein DsbE